MSDKVKLLPCPFCGESLTIKPQFYDRDFREQEPIYFAWHSGVVTDDACMFSGKGIHQKHWGVWNTRAIEATRPPIGTDEVVERTEAEELAMIAAAFPPKPKCDADGKFRPGETLKEYFARNGTPADPEAMAEYERSMREDTIPAIERDLKAQQRAAHFLRLGIPDPAAMKDAASD